MRWIALISLCLVLTSTWGEPDPKKYKSDVKDKTKPFDTSLTDEERKFLREVEAKFGIKSDIPLEEPKKDKDEDKNENLNGTTTNSAPFPAVIAIEIVNDTDKNTKGKRTIDANLGYGYRTNNGYTYTYFGKQPQEKGKFMIYPYSQEDIPPSRPTPYNSEYTQGKYTTSSPNVEIQPSRAYELIDVKDEQNSYTPQNSKPNVNYENIRGLISPPPPYSPSASHGTSNPTFYTTYNGHEFSGLSGQFPTVMSNYLVEPSQLLKNPQYQSAGLNQDYFRNHGSQLEQRVVPVLVLRVPSSYLKKPTAELYSGGNNYPVSNYLNNVNLQEIVNNYFKKIGYSFAPQVMAYQNSLLSQPASSHVAAPVHNSEPQNYAAPYVHPSYTQADYSGVQYSAVQPVMAKYPTTYTRPQYYVQMTQSLYQQPQQQYQYTYQYVPQTQSHTQAYYVQQQQTHTEEAASQQNAESAHEAAEQASVGDSAGHAEYGVPQTATYESPEPSAEYGSPEIQAQQHATAEQTQYETPQTVSQEYGEPKEQAVEYAAPQQTVSAEYGPSKVSLPIYSAPQATRPQYGLPKYTIPKETLAAYQAQLNQNAAKYSFSTGAQNYYYPKQMLGDSGSDSLVLTENYPDKDHTLATVLPVSYKRERKPATVQTVSYVTPVPHKYQSPYKIMVPQTVLKNRDSEKVSYVNSHSLPYSKHVTQEYNPEAEYTVPAHYSPPVGKQKPSGYPRNYHSHKRNVKPENKSESTSSHKKQNESGDNKKKSA